MYKYDHWIIYDMKIYENQRPKTQLQQVLWESGVLGAIMGPSCVASMASASHGIQDRRKDGQGHPGSGEDQGALGIDYPLVN